MSSNKEQYVNLINYYSHIESFVIFYFLMVEARVSWYLTNSCTAGLFLCTTGIWLGLAYRCISLSLVHAHTLTHYLAYACMPLLSLF